MITSVFRIVLVCIIAVALLYISRFWPVELWARDGMLSDLGLRPQGGLLQFWLRGTDFAAFDLVIWSIVVFVTLTVAEKITAPAA